MTDIGTQPHVLAQHSAQPTVRPDPISAFEGFEGGAPGQFTPTISSMIDDSAWPDPIPLPSGLPSVAALNLSLLPLHIAPWISDISDRMQCPPDFAAASAMVALGSIIGRQIGIRPKRNDSWTEFPNLWGMIVGRPGTMKSPAMSEALRPLKRLEAKAREFHQQYSAAYEKELRSYKLRNKAAEEFFMKQLKSNPTASVSIETAVEPAEPKLKRYTINDATYEALGTLLVDNPNGILAVRDELVSLLKTLDKEDNAAARGFFLSAWNGKDGYTFDRIIRGRQHIEAACVSMLGTTQPGRLATYIGRALSGGDGDDGLIQRFSLLVWPDLSDTWRNIDRCPNDVLRGNAERVFDWLAQLDFGYVRPIQDASTGSFYLSFDLQAGERFIAWLSNLEHRLRSDGLHAAMESHLAKYRKLVPALALINHLADGCCGEVSLHALERAIGYANYLETHAHRAYGAGLRTDASTAAAILSRLRRRELGSGFTLRDIHQKDWTNLTNRTELQLGLDLLVDHGWLCATGVSTGGRPKTIYSINPKGLR